MQGPAQAIRALGGHGVAWKLSCWPDRGRVCPTRRRADASPTLRSRKSSWRLSENLIEERIARRAASPPPCVPT